jgi:predicted RNase H-like HicB family nuclease
LASTIRVHFAHVFKVQPIALTETTVRTYSAVIERCPQTQLFVGFVPGFPGAHSQGETLEELNQNLQEVLAMLLEDGEPVLESEFVGIQDVMVA